jgi:hypothetical protein
MSAVSSRLPSAFKLTLNEVIKMKKYYEALAKLFRWMVVSTISFIIALPTWISYTAEI